MDLSDITRDVFQLIASVDAKFDRVSWKLQKSGQKYNFSLVWPIENCDRSNPPRNEVNVVEEERGSRQTNKHVDKTATARLEAGKPSNSKPRKNKSPAQVKRDKVRLEVWRKTWRVGKRGNHGNQDKPVASPHTPPVSVDVLPSADIQSTSTTANAETSPIVHVDTSNEHVELAVVPPPDVHKQVGICPTDAVVSHIDVTCDRKPPNSRSPVVELESSALPEPDETDLDFLDFACGIQKRMCMRCGRPETMSLKLKSCTKCKMMNYCSKDCQISDWKELHKHQCEALSKLRPLNS